jgi:hypothetical protein
MTDAKRPSLREAARRGVEAKKQAQAGQVEQPPVAPVPAASATPAPAPSTPGPAAPRPAPFQKVKPPVVGIEQVTVQCGHVVPFELFDLKKDKFRADRRKKLTDRACTACRVKAQEEKQAAEMEEARKRRLENPKPKKQWPPPRTEGRLPDGSRFDVAWDAAKGEWSGTLTVPTLAPFTAAAPGVFKLLQVLDGMYRATLPAGAELTGDLPERAFAG